MSDRKLADVPTQPEALRALILQFLAWVAERPRTHADVMEAWRTSCPRLTVWEDATTAGLVRLEARSRVVLTPLGRAMLANGAKSAVDAD
jgi:hypothetical protein